MYGQPENRVLYDDGMVVISYNTNGYSTSTGTNGQNFGITTFTSGYVTSYRVDVDALRDQAQRAFYDYSRRRLREDRELQEVLVAMKARTPPAR